MVVPRRLQSKSMSKLDDRSSFFETGILRDLLREGLKKGQTGVVHSLLSRIPSVAWDHELVVLLFRYFPSEVNLSTLHIPLPLLEAMIGREEGVIALPEIRKRYLNECQTKDHLGLFVRLLQFDPLVFSQLTDQEISTWYGQESTRWGRFVTLLEDMRRGGTPVLTHEIYELLCGFELPAARQAFFEAHSGWGRLRDRFGNSLLHYAVLNNHVLMADFFLGKGMSSQETNLWSLTPLNESVRLGYDKITHLLRKHGAYFYSPVDSHQSVIGERQEFFVRLTTLMSHAPLLWKDTDIVFQLFHSVPTNSHLYCCSTYVISSETKHFAFHNATSHFVLDRHMGGNVLRDKPHFMDQCDKMPPHLFFPGPLCKDHGIRYLVTLPFYNGFTFLGYFFLWSTERLNRSRVQLFWDHINLFMDQRFLESFQSFPDLFTIKMRECAYLRQEVEELLEKLRDPRSYQFVRPLRMLSPFLAQLSPETLLIFRTLLDCHMPVTPLASEMYRLLLSLQPLLPPPLPPSSSFLFQQMVQGNTFFSSDSSLLPLGLSPLPPLTSRDLFDILGNHHLVEEIRHVSPDSLFNSSSPRSLWESVVKTVLGVDIMPLRTMAVVGTLPGNAYRLFLPPQDIPPALDLLFQDTEPIATSTRLYQWYHWLLEWIHPLEDGNGRSTRLFLTLYLRQRGVPILFSSEQKTLPLREFELKIQNAISLARK